MKALCCNFFSQSLRVSDSRGRRRINLLEFFDENSSQTKEKKIDIDHVTPRLININFFLASC